MPAHLCMVVLCLPLIGQARECPLPRASLLANRQPAALLGTGTAQPRRAGSLQTHMRGRNQRPGRRDRRREALTLGLATAALIVADRDAHDLIGTNADGADAEVSQWVQTFGLETGAASVAGLYLLGDDYDRTTAKTAATAAASAALTVEALNLLTGRQRPREGSGRGDFRGPFSGGQSFPSGHTAIAFSLATVYGQRYPKHEWAFDALAVGVAVARMREDEHYLSDVFVGALMGTHFGHRALKGKGGLFGFRF